jgi:hypothetical protein
MYDETLIEVAAEADEQLRAKLSAEVPIMAQSVERWLDEVFGGAGLAEVFTRIDAFPMLLIPWWADGSIGERNRQLHRRLTYSTMNGYLYIRLIDNLMDREAPAHVDLLPALSFFHLEFVEPYRRLFPPAHRFWSDFRSIWLQAAEVTMQDGALADVDRTAFERISSRKTGAAKIPVAAVCHYRGRPHLQPRWNGLVEALGRWHQMHNDIFGWRKDLSHDRATFFLSEGRRRRPDTDLEPWLIAEGFSWGMEELAQAMVDLKRIATNLDAVDLYAYLDARDLEVRSRADQIERDLRAVLGLRDPVRG